MGVDFADAALAAGDHVVATGRHTDKGAIALGESENLHIVTFRPHLIARVNKICLSKKTTAITALIGHK